MTNQDLRLIKGIGIGVGIIVLFILMPVIMSIATVLGILVFTLG